MFDLIFQFNVFKYFSTFLNLYLLCTKSLLKTSILYYDGQVYTLFHFWYSLPLCFIHDVEMDKMLNKTCNYTKSNVMELINIIFRHDNNPTCQTCSFSNIRRVWNHISSNIYICSHLQNYVWLFLITDSFDIQLWKIQRIKDNSWL